ncbi:MAG: peptide chain release factor N(5)-glutamine methyltransferase [Lewinellaceae bacterium]|nr:peptide chain release factor N(5)-glutamine methyltransferase [Saprospiraceae bacterium]MCB9345837.1 peptide chain release factor N(5)-glutamine methyltransferase [Lewinellaceae bacterium]
MQFTAAEIYLKDKLVSRYGLGEAASISRIFLEDRFHWKRGDREMTPTELEILENDSTRLEAGVPIQYVLGQADFFGLKFKVDEKVLIPRQETELLVAEIMKHVGKGKQPQINLLDIGVGSGCIGISLKKKIREIRLYGIDKSRDALSMAEENARSLLGIEAEDCHFAEADILNLATLPELPQFDVIVSNPPYIPEAEKHLMPEHVLAHEPWLALFVQDEDPLIFYKAIADFAMLKLRAKGALFFECNEFNASLAAEMLRGKGFTEVELIQDLAGADRILKARKNS